MNNEEVNLDFLDNIKLDDDIDNDISVEETPENYNFDIDEQEEEELDFDLNELITKIDSKLDELNKEESSEINNGEPKEINIETDTEDSNSDSSTFKNNDSILDESNEEATETVESFKDIDENKDYDVNELITKIDSKLEELNKEEPSIVETEELKDNDITSPSEIKETPSNNDENQDYNVNELINKIDEKLEKLNTLDDSSVEDNDSISNENINDTTFVDSQSIDEEISDVIDEKNESENINNLFEKVNSNVREASNIFSKNVEMKKKLDKRFEELKELQKNIELSKQSDYDEINKYKDTVLEELTTKKSEVELRLNELKTLQAEFEKEKNDFENYKRLEKEKLEDLARDNKVKDDSRKEELEALEDKIRKQKDAIDEEKRQLSLDRIQYEADKNELANNMLKFNEIVGTFTDGVGNLN